MSRRPGSRHPGLLAALIVTALVTGTACATTGGLRNAQLAEQRGDYDLAVVEYTKLVRERPDDRHARASLERARLLAAQEHLTIGRRLAVAGRLEEAQVELQIAAELNPESAEVQGELEHVRAQMRTQVAVQGRTRLQTLIAQSFDAPLPGNELPADATLPDSLVFRDASARDVYTAIGRFTNLSVAFDPAFRDQSVTIDLRGVSLAEALDTLSTSTRNFWQVTAPRAIAVIPDTPAKRREFEEEIVRTFYLSNADLKETIDLLRIVVDARRLSPITATNAITIKDTPERVAAAARIIQAVDKARPEVVIDVELLEVDRTRLREYGLQFASPTTTPLGVDGSAGVNREGLTLRDLRSLSQSDVLLTNLPNLYYRLLKNDGNTRTLANPQLRATEGTAAQARFGERVPVPVTTFAPIAAGGVQTQPITSFNYENIGVNIDITPRTHHDDAVSLAVQIEISSISGTGFGGLPTFGNRSINTVIRLRDGETNMLAGLIRDDERQVLAGVPGLSDIPVLGRLFAHSRRETQETDIILTLTPRIVRVLELTEEDLRPFRVGRDATGAGVELLTPPQQPQSPARPPGGLLQGAPDAGTPDPSAPARPVRPPPPPPPPGR
ncbi:MAG: secretin N-terminal domain-containing protein [Vicinamibacteria bacterium]